MPEIAASGFVSVPDGQLFYETTGQGPAIVLIHSAFLDRRMWEPQFASYASGHTVVRYDVRGHGRSKGDRSRSSDGEDLAALLDFLRLPTAFVVGNSDGARIAAEFAAGQRDRVRGLVLVAGSPHDLEPTDEEKARFMDTFPDTEGRLLEVIRAGQTSEAVEQILNLWAPRVPEAERARLRGIVVENYEQLVHFMTLEQPEGRPPSYPVAETLKKGGVPMLSIAGAHDNPALNMMMGRFAAEIPTARYFEIPEGDHTPSLSAQGVFDSLVLQFVSHIEADRAWPPA
jgi:3-oxoadipate enol-lactonase